MILDKKGWDDIRKQPKNGDQRRVWGYGAVTIKKSQVDVWSPYHVDKKHISMRKKREHNAERKQGIEQYGNISFYHYFLKRLKSIMFGVLCS